MKYLEFTPLYSINLFLNNLNVGDCTIKGNLEAFSCKHTGTDRKLSMSLEHEILEHLARSCDSASPSPVDHLSSRSSRKTLIYLVLTLSNIYPDYDFSAIRANEFFRDEEWENIEQTVEMFLSEAAKQWAEVSEGSSFVDSIKKAIDEVINLKECEIYSYDPDFDVDPSVERRTLWSFNFFFYNVKLKRVVSFRCCCNSNLADGLPADAETDNEDMLVDMDM